MSDKNHPQTAQEHELDQALLAFDQQLSEWGAGRDEEATIGASETDAVIQENLETLRLLDAIRWTNKESPPAQNRIGRFQLVGELGRGGFGVVLLARDPRLNRLVALKVPRPEVIVTEELRQRFFREAEAAAALNHPNILPIYEQGAAGPIGYIAMAYCAGPSLAQWIEKNGTLDPRIAARIVATLADALQHAHNRGVLHRDVKPANVLIDIELGQQTDDGQQDDSIAAAALPYAVRLTDFGMARLGEDQAQTKTGDILGTPLYMSPEQAVGHRTDIGNSSDIYSLGATLYFLLTGKPPLQGKSSVDTLIAIQNQDPLPPSHHERRIPADLDAICLKCLEKSPMLRYASATELVADLERFLTGVPVQAREITPLVRAGRWCTRNPLLTAAAGMIIVIMAGSMVWINHERNAAIAEADRATKSAKRSTDVLKVVTDSFQEVNPHAGWETKMSAKDVLRNVKESLKSSDLDEEGRALLLGTLSRCFSGLTDFKSAIELAEEAVELTTRLYGPDHVDTIEAVFRLGVANRWAGNIEKAVPLLERVYEARQRHLGTDHADSISATVGLAAGYHEIGRTVEAVELYEQAVAAYRRTSKDQDTFLTMSNLCVCYRRTGRSAEAISMGEQALEGLKAVAGPEHIDTLTAMGYLAMSYVVAGRPDDALPLQTEVLNHREEKFGLDHLDTIIACNNLAYIYQDLGRYDESISLYERTLQSFKTQLGPNHIDTQVPMGHLTRVYHAVGRHEDAISLLKSALEVSRSELGAEAPNTLTTQNSLAIAYQNAGRFDEALTLFGETLAARREILGNAHSATITTLSDLAYTHERAGNLDQALPMFEEVHALRCEHLDENHPDTIGSTIGLAGALIKKQKYEDAEPLLREYVDYAQANQPDGWRLFRGKSMLGESLLGQQRFEEAKTLLIEGYQGLAQRTMLIESTERKQRLQTALERLGNYAKAVEDEEAAARWLAKLQELDAAE